ncbi:agamous-like MADS-box protein AGL80 [Pyrus ussuriensis x Pyrus communis]|uniref:Agamous-like MADS-box protein AGL80 n=1 Tax=Pyrus ussuriensis x Pyrus communis TaxID=2448454 RepID=A0A5N5HY05_9ROSA|nr:agamous-like MADS-box protein AGL80 [Pyrus ussuriensis x Pyrus communis]
MAGRKKVKLAYIINDACRKASYNKRKKGFVKKMKEISILCDVPVCGILYSQYESQPIVWPNPLVVQRLITQFRNMPEEERNKKMVNHEMFLKQRIEKEQEKLNKLKKENREKQIRMLMNQCLAGRPLTELNLDALNDMDCMIKGSLTEIATQIKSRKEKELAEMNQPQVAPPQVLMFDQSNIYTKQTVPWFLGDVPNQQFGFADDQIPPL